MEGSISSARKWEEEVDGNSDEGEERTRQEREKGRASETKIKLNEYANMREE